MRSLLAFLFLAVVSGIACYFLRGWSSVVSGFDETGREIIGVLPNVALGLIVAGTVTVLVPKQRVAKWLGREAGLKGMVIATGIGAIMPGGPFASFPLVFALAQAGADIGALVSFLTAWAAIGVNRLLIWEIPFMGTEFGILRFVSSLPLPILGGIMARYLHHRFQIFRFEQER